MTEQSKEIHHERRANGVRDRRRRNNDIPQPLDYVTRELVRDIVENRQQTALSPKSFIQKILKAD